MKAASPKSAETAASQSTSCICQTPKEPGQLVCWHCFKHRTDAPPLKDFPDTYQAWVNSLPNITTMPAKSTSPEAAQNKLRRLEIRDLEKTRKKIRADFRNEQKQLIKTAESAHKAVLKFQDRAEKQLPKLEADIDRRVGILRGRLGI